jgi:ribosomal protein S18 acetylase RimI-like enzyme
MGRWGHHTYFLTAPLLITDVMQGEDSSMERIEIVEADLDRPEHQRAVLDLTDAYATDSMGNGRPLDAEVRRGLIPGLRKHPTTLIFIAYDQGRPAGIATCFYGFSTFAARRLINIHDLAVLPEYRGRGIGHRLLQEVERKARDTSCCKLTLEVQQNNLRARRLYEALGFGPLVYQDGAGEALFLVKAL